MFIFCILNLMHAVEDGKMRLFTDHLVGSIVAHGRGIPSEQTHHAQISDSLWWLRFRWPVSTIM